MATRRLGRGLVSLAASAITAVYVAGYVHTQSADASLAPSEPAPAAPRADSRQPAPAPTFTTTPATRAPGQTLKDGTYTGIGTSRRGDIQVQLSVQGGRIAAVNITRATTQYPTRFIAGLQGEVVSRQSAQVDVVGGATYSSLAFRGAVQQALQRAQS